MKPNTRVFAILAAVAIAATCLAPNAALATCPNANSAVLKTRVFNDCPSSTLTTLNAYPGLISIDDSVLDCGGFANLHIWNFSEDGATAAVFNNDDSFTMSAELTISGTSEGEAGMRVSPWWSQDVDGRFNVRTSDGEVACFGGRLPFYSFTGSHGVVYAKGTTIILTVTYTPNDLNVGNPATIEYEVDYGGHFTSGPIPFDEGNPAEGMGSWGMLDDARVGGYIQAFLQGGNPGAELSADWANINYMCNGPVSVENSTWSGMKALYR
ncbi:MAG: hypothetical protein DHS20C21_03720 [Gemmatimonadota bacterium]|nr:MAG: hypothetical protein DHS20C21_03720 [Gemmatimonadota bacterium]